MAIVNMEAAPSEGGEINIDTDLDVTVAEVENAEEGSRLRELEKRVDALKKESARVVDWFRDQIRGVENYGGRVKKEIRTLASVLSERWAAR